mmetsp:Transcript_14348/g.30923  ORF Transcript_14348/g.30923 Transcript_14348/m.30923 type:complete len:295 (+) Transcript_14348:95-979(+)
MHHTIYIYILHQLPVYPLEPKTTRAQRTAYESGDTHSFHIHSSIRHGLLHGRQLQIHLRPIRLVEYPNGIFPQRTRRKIPRRHPLVRHRQPHRLRLPIRILDRLPRRRYHRGPRALHHRQRQRYARRVLRERRDDPGTVDRVDLVAVGIQRSDVTVVAHSHQCQIEDGETVAVAGQCRLRQSPQFRFVSGRFRVSVARSAERYDVHVRTPSIQELFPRLRLDRGRDVVRRYALVIDECESRLRRPIEGWFERAEYLQYRSAGYGEGEVSSVVDGGLGGIFDDSVYGRRDVGFGW